MKRNSILNVRKALTGCFLFLMIMTGTWSATIKTKAYFQSQPGTNLLVRSPGRIVPTQTKDDAARLDTPIRLGNASAQVGEDCMSDDGRFMVFVSSSSNLIPGQIDTNTNTNDVFLFDRQLGTYTLVSHNADSLTTTCNRGAGIPRISSDGRFVVFGTTSTDVVPNQIDRNDGHQFTPDMTDIFLFDRQTSGITLVTGAGNSANQTADFGLMIPPSVAMGDISPLLLRPPI